MPTSSFRKKFVIDTEEAAERLVKVLLEKDIYKNKDYQKIDIEKKLKEGREMAKRYFGRKNENNKCKSSN